MRVDEARPDRRSRIEPHRGGGFSGEPAPERRSRRRDVRAETREPVVAERAEPDALEELARPALFMRQIAKLAGDRAERTRERAGGAKCQEVGQTDEMRGLAEGLGFHPRKPGELRRLHLRRHRASEIAQNLMPGGGHALGVLGGAMIHPHDDVAFGRIGGAHRQRPQAAVERHQRTGRGEADAGERVARKAGSLDRFAHGLRDCAPDVS